MANPDVRVRLSAEGEEQVVRALQKTLQQTNRTAAGMSRSIDGVNRSLGNLQTLLLQIGAVVSVGALVTFTKNAAAAADQVGKMSQSVGASVKNLSALRAVALTANLSMEQLQASLTIFNRRATEALAGSDKAAKAFKALGISLEQIRGKDAAERMALVAQALSRMEDSPEKVALGFEFFGRQIGNLIPLLNDLGAIGLEGAIRKAEELGIAFSEDAARAAQTLNDDFAILQAQTQSLGVQFVQGLAPAVHAALGGVQKDLAASSKGMVRFGQIVGEALTVGILGFVGFVDQIITSIQKLGNAGRAVIEILAALARGPSANTAAQVIIAHNKALNANLQLQKEFDQRQEDRLARAEEIGFRAAQGIASLPALRAGQPEIEAPIIPEEERERKRKEKSAEQLAFERALLQFKAEQNKLDFEAAKIQAAIAAGTTSQFEGEQKLLALDRERLPVLRQLAASALAAAQALGDEEAIERARELGRTVELMAIEVEASNQLLQRLGATVQDTLVSALTEFFATGIREAKSFGDAVRGLALTVIDSIQRILSAELAAAAVRAAFGVFGFPIPGAARGGVVEAATGGAIRGPGSGTSDSIPAMLSNGEFVVRASVVERPGVLAALSRINDGMSTPALGGSVRARGYADGGLVSGAGNRHESRLTVALGPGLVLSEIETPEGERAILRVLSKNPRSSRSALGQG